MTSLREVLPASHFVIVTWHQVPPVGRWDDRGGSRWKCHRWDGGTMMRACRASATGGTVAR